MELPRTQAQLREQWDALRSQYVATELDLAITFCQVAATTNDPARYGRNIANAQEAYSAAVYFLGCNHLKSTLTLEINEKLLRLNSVLVSFGSRASGLWVQCQPVFEGDAALAGLENRLSCDTQRV